MHEILRNLRPGALALDLGCAQGSFAPEATAATIIRVDREPPRSCTNRAAFVQADAARLPFANAAFAAVIANHSLEHFADLDGALREIGRVVEADRAALFVSLPDASTLTDKLYRWLGRGGGHVNAFTSLNGTASVIERTTGLPLVATRTLYSSLAFLNRRNARWPRRRWLVGAGFEWTLFLYAWLSRWLDRRFHTRVGVYGWAFYFGNLAEEIDTKTRVNVCIRCGSASSEDALVEAGAVRSGFVRLRVYGCPECGTVNPFAEDPK